jgi:hypothetical protein
MKRISAAAAAAAAFAGMISAAPAATAETQANAAPPAAPTNLHVVHQTANQVQLAWNGPSAVTGRPSYFVSGPPCSPQMVGSGTEATLSSSSVDPTCGLSPGQEYQITVRAQDDTGQNSPYSNVVSVTLTG